VGKLGVSNRILDSPHRLSPEERAVVEQHPLHTWAILEPVGAFREFAWTAATHHEKLDGTGYPWRLGADALDLPARILAVADVYEALTADRPYRAGMSHGAANGRHPPGPRAAPVRQWRWTHSRRGPGAAPG
jgi:HD-GYP domain-containing protein (c-di-GMP phosphodiesterase class II)